MPDIQIAGTTFRVDSFKSDVILAYLMRAGVEYADPILLDLKLKQIDREVAARRTEIEVLLQQRDAIILNKRKGE